MTKAPVNINPELCKKCGLCVYYCPQKVLEGKPGELPHIKAPENCGRCRLCFNRCPDFAIEVEVDRA